jgi:hypothetical protein
MNRPKHNAVGADAMYVILGASGNTGSVIANSLLSSENTTPTSFEKFVQDVFAPAYRAKAVTA